MAIKLNEKYLDGFVSEADLASLRPELEKAVKTVSDAFTPVSGEVVEVNPAIDADPSLVNKDPYGEGWMVKIKMSAPEEVEALLSADDYADFIAK